MSERRKLKQSLFEQISLSRVQSSQGHGANVSVGSFASQDPGTLLPTVVFSRFLTPAWCKTFRDRAFAVAVPRFWNSRPLDITESGY